MTREGNVPVQASPHFILGTAGHIDHGKSTLVQALTGTDPDRLAEEKRRGITIELGFARLELDDGTALGVVDVPGHERFVRQMIAGATGIDLALLCIAADDGIMPQTAEHLAVLELLGIERAVIALTKTDLVDADWVELITEEVREYLASTSYSNAPLVPVSARTGDGLADLRAELARAVRGLTRAHDTTTPRLPIDRSFSIKGSGTVVTGTLWSGTIAPGDELEALPGGPRARVRGVQTHGQAVECAEAGNRVAVNLGAVSTEDVRPGMLLTTPGTLRPTDRFDTQVTYLASEGDTTPLATGTRMRIAHGTEEVLGRVLFMDGLAELAPRSATFAQIRLDEPLPVVTGDRFVMRSLTPVQVVGGGIVLHPHPRRRTTLREGEQALLEALLTGDTHAACDAAFAQQKTPVTAAEVARAAGISEDAAARRLEERHAAGALIRLGMGADTHYTTRGLLQKHTSALENELLRFHAERPTAPGLSKRALLDRLPSRLTEACFEALVQDALSAGHIIIDNGLIAHPKAGAGARKLEEQAAEALINLLADAGSTPPSVDGLIAQAGIEASAARRALTTLEKAGHIHRVSPSLVFDTAAYTALEDAAVAFLCTHARATAAELRDALGVSRKYAIPLLEHFDAQGVTRRVGDERELGPKRA